MLFLKNIIEKKIEKWKINKVKQKIIAQQITKNCKKDRESIIEIFLKMRKLKNK